MTTIFSPFSHDICAAAKVIKRKRRRRVVAWKKEERERERRFKVYIPQVVFLASRRISFPLFILTSACVSALLQVTNWIEMVREKGRTRTRVYFWPYTRMLLLGLFVFVSGNSFVFFFIIISRFLSGFGSSTWHACRLPLCPCCVVRY